MSVLKCLKLYQPFIYSESHWIWCMFHVRGRLLFFSSLSNMIYRRPVEPRPQPSSLSLKSDDSKREPIHFKSQKASPAERWAISNMNSLRADITAWCCCSFPMTAAMIMINLSLISKSWLWKTVSKMKDALFSFIVVLF